MDSASSVAASYKALQESASALYHRRITPLLQRCGSYHRGDLHSLDVQEKRAIQQTENLKWQQDMFHRILNLICLFNEGLVSQMEVRACKLQAIQQLKSLHQDGEWADFTRDKLLFLQDLLFAACISEEEYHDAKKPLILRLAEQGAILDAQDFIFGAGVTNSPKVHTKSARTPKKKVKAQAISGDASPAIADDINSSPLKQVMGAVRRRNTPNGKCGKAKEIRRVPHALDFLRPENCPMRDPPSPAIGQKPLERESPSPLFRDVLNMEPCPSSQDAIRAENNLNNSCGPVAAAASSSPPRIAVPVETNVGSPPACVTPLQYKSPSTTLSRFKTLLSGLITKAQCDTESAPNFSNESDCDDDPEEERPKKFSRPPKKQLQFDEFADQHSGLGEGNAYNEPLLMDTASRGGGEGPNTVRLKKKVNSKGAPTDFFIDKVLGENIKNELSRIRAEMNTTQPGQTFTNEQIDAIATRLPVDKGELKKFFPQSWCERYGEVVLEVVRKEFTEHVGEMEKLRKAGKEKRGIAAAMKTEVTVEENDENSSAAAVKLNKCFTTTPTPDQPVLQQHSPNKQHHQWKHSPNPPPPATQFHGLDRKLGEELLRMPFRKVNEYGSHLRP